MPQTLKLQYAAAQSLTVTGLATLANGSSATSAAIDNTANLYVDLLVEVVVTTASGATATGIVEVYGKASIDNSDFDDDANDRWLGSLALAAAGAGTYKRILPVATAFGGTVPPYLQVRVKNSTGAALTAGTASYLGASAQSA